MEIRPGIVTRNNDGQLTCRPIFTKIVSLHAENNELPFAVPGGLIGVGTRMDPNFCRADRLVGQVLGKVGRLPQIYSEVVISYFLLRRLLGVRSVDGQQARVERLSKRESLMLNIGSLSVGGTVIGVREDAAKIHLSIPACTEVGEKIALSRRIDNHWRLIGWGTIRRGTEVIPDFSNCPSHLKPLIDAQAQQHALSRQQSHQED